MGGNEQKKILYDYLFIVHIARYFLEKGYSVIVDRSFSTGHKRFLTVLEQEAKERKTKFFLIRIKAPKRFILRKIKNLKPTSEEKYLPDKKTGVDCYLYALKNYKKFYDALKPRALAVINTSKPIPNSSYCPANSPFLNLCIFYNPWFLSPPKQKKCHRLKSRIRC